MVRNTYVRIIHSMILLSEYSVRIVASARYTALTLRKVRSLSFVMTLRLSCPCEPRETVRCCRSLHAHTHHGHELLCVLPERILLRCCVEKPLFCSRARLMVHCGRQVELQLGEQGDHTRHQREISTCACHSQSNSISACQYQQAWLGHTSAKRQPKVQRTQPQ